MKENLLMTSMCLVDDEYIAEASPIAAKPMTHIRRKIIRKYISLAACLAAVLILGQDMLVSLRLIPTTIHILPQYTASSLGNLNCVMTCCVVAETGFPITRFIMSSMAMDTLQSGARRRHVVVWIARHLLRFCSIATLMLPA